jgi:hypothetical protein
VLQYDEQPEGIVLCKGGVSALVLIVALLNHIKQLEADVTIGETPPHR